MSKVLPSEDVGDISSKQEGSSTSPQGNDNRKSTDVGSGSTSPQGNDNRKVTDVGSGVKHSPKRKGTKRSKKTDEKSGLNSPPPPEINLAVLKLSEKRVKSLLTTRLTDRKGCLCVLRIFREDVENGVSDVKKYWQKQVDSEEGSISPFAKYKWLDRFFVTAVILENTMEKEKRRVVALSGEAASNFNAWKYDDATNLAESLQTMLWQEWHASKAIERWIEEFPGAATLMKEEEWFGAFVIFIAQILKNQQRLSYSNYFFFGLAFIAVGVYIASSIFAYNCNHNNDCEESNAVSKVGEMRFLNFA